MLLFTIMVYTDNFENTLRITYPVSQEIKKHKTATKNTHRRRTTIYRSRKVLSHMGIEPNNRRRSLSERLNAVVHVFA